MLQTSWSTNHYSPETPGETISGSKTHAFFASSFDSPAPPPNLPRSQDVTKTKSLTLDFFALNSPSTPLPPPSIRPSPLSRNSSAGSSTSTSSDDSSSASSHILSRLFPSRYNTVDDAYSRRRILELGDTPDEVYIEDTSTQETPKPSTTLPCYLSAPKPIPIVQGPPLTVSTQLSTSPTEYRRTFSPDRLPAGTLSMDSLPTPSSSRNGSIYEPAVPLPRSLPRESDHLVREPHLESSSTPLEPGSVISSDTEGYKTSIELIRPLGQGSFSSVWLGRDASGGVERLVVSRRASIKRQQTNGVGIVRRRSSRRLRSKVDGTKPWGNSEARRTRKDSSVDYNSFDAPAEEGRLVAVKFTERALCDANDRTRVSFIREVEVLKHISHPSIVSFIHSFTTQSHHCLVLEHIDGQELFDLINSDEKYALLDTPTLRRIWGELCKAVGFLHEVHLVHRDIKLENIMLTRDLRSHHSPAPLIKLTDFGLSRFIDPENPVLTTRCGSESYAAPEIITGKKYDGRETDAWACGVVLYALATRKLPFDTPRSGFNSGRKGMLMRIANCDYQWPEHTVDAGLKRIVGRLLVRDPRKRAQVKHLWDDEWMLGEGAPNPPPPATPPMPALEYSEDECAFDEDDFGDDGLIVDGDRIASVASEELQ